MRAHLRSSLPAFALLLGGCIEEYAPDVGPPQSALCVNEDSNASEEVSFATVQELVFDAPRPTRCTNCHDPEADNPIGVNLGGLVLTDWDSLIEGGVNSGSAIVVPGQPCDSILFQKLLPGPPFGSRMPFNGPPFLTTVELGLVHDWIAEGAEP